MEDSQQVFIDLHTRMEFHTNHVNNTLHVTSKKAKMFVLISTFAEIAKDQLLLKTKQDSKIVGLLKIIRNTTLLDINQ